MLNGTMLHDLLRLEDSGTITAQALKIEFLRLNLDLNIYYEDTKTSLSEEPIADYFTIRPCGIKSLYIHDTDKVMLTVTWCNCADPAAVMIATLDAWLIGLGWFEE